MGLFLSHSLEHPFGVMPVISILQWSAEIGIFNTKHVKYLFKSKYWANDCPWNLNKFYIICCMFLLLLICVGDIELNPGPRKVIPLITFLFAIGMLTVLWHIIFQIWLNWKLITYSTNSIWFASQNHS